MSTKRSKLNKGLVYFDNAASSVRSKELVEDYLHLFETKRTPEMEKNLLFDMASKISSFLNAPIESISFTPNASYSLNEIAHFLFRNNANRKVFLSTSEHASNQVIWMNLYGPSAIEYFDLADFLHLSFPNKSIISFPSLSNLEGIEVNIFDFEIKFRNSNHILIVDATQFIQHKKIDLSKSCISYLAFSAHKVFGPNGIGVIYSKNNDISMGINAFNYEKKSKNYFLDFDALEAWKNSFDYISKKFDSGEIQKKEQELRDYFLNKFPKNKFVEIANNPTGCIFLLKVIVDSISAHDYVFYLSSKGVIVRSGESCSLFASEKFEIRNIFRVSLNHTNTIEEIKYFFSLIKKFKEFDCC